MEDRKKCTHATCTCTAAPLSDYCCETCRIADEREEAGEVPMSECHCMHEDCGGQPDIPIETQSMLIASTALAEA